MKTEIPEGDGEIIHRAHNHTIETGVGIDQTMRESGVENDRVEVGMKIMIGQVVKDGGAVVGTDKADGMEEEMTALTAEEEPLMLIIMGHPRDVPEITIMTIEVTGRIRVTAISRRTGIDLTVVSPEIEITEAGQDETFLRTETSGTD